MMVNIEIDGKPVEAKKGAMVIEAADAAGIVIPRFCYHKKLSIAANCRMCLVEVEKVGKPLPACATPIADGMKIFTQSKMALDAQRGTMEFLLINHPLDCPICDQGGECELQEMSMGYGDGASRYEETKVVVKDKDIGPLIQTDMTRCIKCTRCVRFGAEIGGIRELGLTGRGEHVTIETFLGGSMTSEMSGNVIDLCPVGALTSKPFRYTARPWELAAHPSIAPHDAVGSNIYIHSRSGNVMRVLPRDNEALNECWISDRDRYSYVALNHQDRLTVPMVKENGQWQETDWNTALDRTAAGLQMIISENGAKQLGFMVSPSSTLEEMYLAQKLARGLGSHNIDHRLRQLDSRDQELMPLAPWLGQSLDELESSNAVLLIGSNVRKEQPIVAHRLRKAAQKGARVMFVNMLDYDINFPVAETIVASPAGMQRALGGIARALLEISGNESPQGMTDLVAGIDVNDTMKAIASHLQAAERATIILGSSAMSHPAFSILNVMASAIAEASGAVLGYLADGANNVGGWLAGMVPHRTAGGAEVPERGLSARAMFDAGLKGYLLHNIEPEYDSANPAAALRALGDAEFVAVLAPYKSNVMMQYADVLLPVVPYSETSGTYVNAEGRWQSFTGAVTPLGEARPAWKVFRVLGNLTGVDGFDHIASTDVKDELQACLGGVKLNGNRVDWHCPDRLGTEEDSLMRIGDVPIYAVDNIVRRSEPLQQTMDVPSATARVNRRLSQHLDLADGVQIVARQGDFQAPLILCVDDRVPDNCVYIPVAINGVTGLGASTAPVEIEKLA